MAIHHPAIEQGDFLPRKVKTNLKRYGVRSTSQVPAIREKQVQTLYKNQTKIASSQQRYINNLKVISSQFNEPYNYGELRRITKNDL